MCNKYSFIMLAVYLIIGNANMSDSSDSEITGVILPTKCEVCKYLAIELQQRLEMTGRVHDVIETGYSFDGRPRKKTRYEKSELRLIESLDKICEMMLQYNIHKERSDSTRFAKGMSTTFKTLNNLVAKGVKVDIGVPHELWDSPTAETDAMKKQCESLLEEYEEVVENWYWNQQEKIDLKTYFCSKHVLKDNDNSCLFEEPENKKEKGEKVKHSVEL